MRCPGYCGDCLRSDWRFGMGQRQYSMELRERASSTPRQTPNLSTSPFSSNNARATAPVMGRCTRSEGVHCLQIGCSAPNHKNKRGIRETTADTPAASSSCCKPPLPNSRPLHRGRILTVPMESAPAGQVATGPEARRPRLMWALALGPCASSLPSRSASARPRFSLSGVLHGAVRARGRHQ